MPSTVSSCLQELPHLRFRVPKVGKKLLDSLAGGRRTPAVDRSVRLRGEPGNQFGGWANRLREVASLSHEERHHAVSGFQRKTP